MDVAGTSVQQIQPADGANLDLEIVKITQTGTKGRQSRSDEGLDMPAPSLEGSERPENLSINLPSEPPPLSHPPEETKAPAQSQESALAETLIQPGDEVQPVPVRPAPARTGPDGSILYFPWEEDPLQTKLHGSDPLNADPVKATEVEDTRPQHGHRARGLDLHPAPLFEEVPQLQYTFLLIPRLPQQELDPRLVNPLAHWFHELCLTFGWKLLSMDIQATYLECAVQVTPQVSPGNLVRILRNHTSQRIFAVFPNLAEDNPTGDFWAPGYLIVSGRQPPEPEAVAAFIRNTRRRQGY
jgi:REP element-mobilizing transposase RayT